MSDPERYESPLGTRYASPAMQRLWSAKHRAGLWRRLWLALAEEQRRLGVDIPEQALEEMRTNLDTADLDQVRRYEHRLRHDVMAHIHHFGDQAPTARPFIHLGATSAYATDNADLIVMREGMHLLMREGMHLLLGRLRALLRVLGDFAATQRDLPTVAFTHFQPAQLTTVGKRATLWLQDLAIDAEALHDGVEALPFRGCKGTTGTQASYLARSSRHSQLRLPAPHRRQRPDLHPQDRQPNPGSAEWPGPVELQARDGPQIAAARGRGARAD